LVTGKDSYRICGAKEIIGELIEQYNVVRFFDFEKNPQIKDVRRGIKRFKEDEFDITIAVGGGSVIDMAKLISILSVQPDNPEKYVKKEKTIQNTPKPLIAIPTTAGSGSEATHFAVIYIGKKKYSLAHPYILPAVSIVDPTFTRNLPSHHTATSGTDALSQAIESYWSVNSNEESKKYAKGAITLLYENLIQVFDEPTNENRLRIATAAHLAGKAINISKTTAAHAISYPFTINYGIPHGHAVGLTLGEVLVFNSMITSTNCIDKRGVEFVKKTLEEIYLLLGAMNAKSAKNVLTGLMQKIGLKTRLSELKIDLYKEIDVILENVNLERLSNNPRQLNRESLEEILRRIA
jgi:alcohol dehydrogenase class IV